MAITNHERVGKAMDLLKSGLGPFIEREFKNTYGAGHALNKARLFLGDDTLNAKKPMVEWDAAVQLRIMWEAWNEVFRNTLGQAERSLIGELRDTRNKWAHQQAFSSDDTYRALDSASRLLTAVSAEQAAEVDRMKQESLRVRFEEQRRTEQKKTVEVPLVGAPIGSLKPWREVVAPHADVAGGHYQQAEFAADLWQVHLGEGSNEYREPVEFYRRTYLTESLKRLLVGAVQRLGANGGDPVVQLQTNFGGGKTHSMLALYHLFSGVQATTLAGVETILAESGVAKVPKVNRVVLVGNKISPGNPITKPDGTVVRTLWGELAWQLGSAAGGPKEARKAFKQIEADDEKATNPGDKLRELFNTYSPCLILVDEWVAYARQLHGESDLPAGSFETQFTFAQALTESAKLAKNCLLVVSLPASDTSGSPHTRADDVEVGGQRGREALERLRNVVGRLEASWRPATAEEGFEIVRRRLFEPLIQKEQYVARDAVAREFYDFYRTQQQEFPAECRDTEYERRIKDAYPIHPEVFDRLYADWSTLVKFQRTRGVLRLMAAVIHCLWERGDRNPLIMPASIPIDDSRIRSELTRYLSDNWDPVIEKDVDGPNSLPVRMDQEHTNLGKYHACRRVARAIYMGSAPTVNAANLGVEDRRVKLGCVMPGESPAIFGDALRRLSSSATYLYQDGQRYWYSTQPTVTKLAEDRADLIKRDADKVALEVDRRVRADLTKAGEFQRVHPMPQSSQDVPDDIDARLVVLGIEQPYEKGGGSTAEKVALNILETRGSTPRLFRNALVFLAPDRTRLTELVDATCRYLAWKSIVDEKVQLNLSPFQLKQAEGQLQSADLTVTARLPEAYQWLLVPAQKSPQEPITWEVLRLSGSEALAVRCSKKLRGEEMLIASFGANRLRMELDKIPLWRGNHVELKQLVQDFARYVYLPRLSGPEVLMGAVRDGLGLLTWEKDSFAYAESFDDSAGRYRGLRCGQHVMLSTGDPVGYLVKPDVASAQALAERPAEVARAAEESRDAAQSALPGMDTGLFASGDAAAGKPLVAAKPKRFHGSVALDSTRVGRDAGRIAEEVVSHLAGLAGAKVRVSLEIEAEVEDGVPENVVRIVTENAKTLKFESQGFERE